MNWIKLHPIKAVLFAIAFTFIGIFAAFRPDLHKTCFFMFILVLVCWIALAVWHKLLWLLLVCTFLAPTARATGHKKGGEVAIGVVVICAGTYCVYKLAKFCQAHFPPPPNTNKVNFGASPLECGASFVLNSCTPSTNTFTTNLTTFTINSMVSNGRLVTAVSANEVGSTMAQFMAGIQAHGLAAGESYEMNGRAAPATAVPISYSPTTGTITNGVVGAEFTVSVQLSHDATTWIQLFNVTASEGTAFQVVDTSTDSTTFYRLILTKL